MAKSARSKHAKRPRNRPERANASRKARTDISEDTIRAGERIALAAFSSGLKLAAAFGTVAAKTAGLALASLASGADKFSELVKEEALQSYDGQFKNAALINSKRKITNRAKGRRKAASR